MARKRSAAKLPKPQGGVSHNYRFDSVAALKAHLKEPSAGDKLLQDLAAEIKDHGGDAELVMTILAPHNSGCKVTAKKAGKKKKAKKAK